MTKKPRQLPLFPRRKRGAARHSDPETSKQAAASIDAETLQARVVHELRQRGPGTIRQISGRLRRDPWSISPRFKPLETLGLIERAGHQVQENGRAAIVWRARERADYKKETT